MALLDKLSKSDKQPVDIALLHLTTEDGTNAADLSITKNGGGVCYGLQKLCQKFVMTLLTPKGSMKFMPDKGSNFVTMVQGAQTERQVGDAFILSLVDVKKQLLNSESEDMSPSERYGSAELVDVSFWFDTISVSIRLFSMDGNSKDVILPIYSL